MSQSTSLHVAVIMDGNGRWAARRGLPRAAGHRAGADAVRRIVEAAPDQGVAALTLFAFSADNWKRPASEVAALMRLFARHLHTETPRLLENGVRLDVVGRRDRLPAPLLAAIRDAERATARGTRLRLRLAVDYSARAAIADRRLLPDVDLLIRTGGEQRLSDFLLWECAYAELYFTEIMWPDFTAADLADALLVSNFATRDADALRALDAMGLAILLALAGLSLRGVALRGRDAWEYVRSVVVAALSAWFGVWPLMARDIHWSELPTGGALRHARGAIAGALLAFPLLLAFGGLFAAADPVFRNVVATALHVDFSAVASHLALTALWTALTAGYFWGAL